MAPAGSIGRSTICAPRTQAIGLMLFRRPPTWPRRHLGRPILALAVVFVTTLAAAQDLRELGASDNEIRNQRRVTGNSLTFCVNAGSVMADFDRDLAAALAGALLLEHQIVELTTEPPVPPYDFQLPLDDLAIFRLLARSCDAIVGFSLLSNYPDWLTPSPPYLTTPTILAVRGGSYASLNDVPRSKLVGTRSSSLADNYFGMYLRALPEGQRWERVFYLGNQQLIERLVDQSVDAILVWEPAILTFKRDNPNIPIDLIDNLPFPIEPSQFALALRPQERFINLALSDAIHALQADGTIDRLAEEHGLIPAGGR